MTGHSAHTSSDESFDDDLSVPDEHPFMVGVLVPWVSDEFGEARRAFDRVLKDCAPCVDQFSSATVPIAAATRHFYSVFHNSIFRDLAADATRIELDDLKMPWYGVLSGSRHYSHSLNQGATSPLRTFTITCGPSGGRQNQPARDGDALAPQRPPSSGSPQAREALLRALHQAEATVEELRSALRALDATENIDEAEPVELDTATGGTIDYTLPLAQSDTLTASKVGELLSPSGKGYRSTAKARRESGELLGIKIGNQYRYPIFQFDFARHAIRPVVAYANREMEAAADPWGVLEWWFSAHPLLQGQTPESAARAETLTSDLVNSMVAWDNQGME